MCRGWGWGGRVCVIGWKEEGAGGEGGLGGGRVGRTVVGVEELRTRVLKLNTQHKTECSREYWNVTISCIHCSTREEFCLQLVFFLYLRQDFLLGVEDGVYIYI